MKKLSAISKEEDLEAWKTYKASPTPQNRSALLKRFEGVINGQVNKWAGGVSRDILLSEAKVLAAKAFDTYRPEMGTALATHVTNALLPLSRTVYTYQNAARMPENITLKLNTYNAAVENLKAINGRDPTTDEIHDQLGWSAKEITRMRDYNVRDLVESGQAVSGDFFAKSRDDEDDYLLGGVYMELMPDEKRLFEHITGYNGAKKMGNGELMKTLGLSQAQLSYKKTLLQKKIDQIMQRPGVRRML